MEKRTKIVATTGPACGNRETIGALIREGVNVFRLNFSHKSYEEANNEVTMIRAARKELDRPVAIMADIKGPAVRLYGYSDEIVLKAGDELTIESADAVDIEKLVAKSQCRSIRISPKSIASVQLGKKLSLWMATYR